MAATQVLTPERIQPAAKVEAPKTPSRTLEPSDEVLTSEFTTTEAKNQKVRQWARERSQQSELGFHQGAPAESPDPLSEVPNQPARQERPSALLGRGTSRGWAGRQRALDHLFGKLNKLFR